MTRVPFLDVPQSDRRPSHQEKERGKAVLTIRTDRPEAEVGLYDGQKQLAYEKWPAHRELSDTIHKKINEILDLLSISLEEVQGIVVFKGPGSFTGLRIGLSVANGLAYSLNIPVVAAAGPDWLKVGLKSFLEEKNDIIALPEYGSPANVSKPRK